MTLMDFPVAPPSPQPVTPRQRPPPPTADGEQRLTLTGISWATYVRLSDEVGPTPRITYDRGRMEIVTLSAFHELVNKCLARIVEAYADAAEIDAEGLGGTTLRREGLDRGLDLTIDPPPDLAIEVDISPPDVVEPPIYATLGVPEVWRYDGRAVTYLVRGADGEYLAAERSLAFPGLPVAWGERGAGRRAGVRPAGRGGRGAAAADLGVSASAVIPLRPKAVDVAEARAVRDTVFNPLPARPAAGSLRATRTGRRRWPSSAGPPRPP